VLAIVGAVAEETIQIDDTRTLYRHRPVSLSTAEVANPVRGDRVTIDGEVWTVHERLPQDGGMVRVTVERAEAGGRGLGRSGAATGGSLATYLSSSTQLPSAVRYNSGSAIALPVTERMKPCDPFATRYLHCRFPTAGAGTG
jgi:hypothetical protein